MKFCFNCLCILCIVSLIMFTGKSNAAEKMQICPKGCFCIYDGKLPERMDMKNICGHDVAQRMSCDDNNKVVGFAYAGGAYEGHLSCTRDRQAEYYFDEFSELYITAHGMYGFIGQDLLTMPFFSLNGYGSNVGVYQCPSSYPSSQPGAKTVFECYKSENGKKSYYTNETAQYSQTVNNKIDVAKAMIKAGVVLDNNNNQEERTGLFNKLSGKSIRSSSAKPSNINLETAKKMIKAGM